MQMNVRLAKAVVALVAVGPLVAPAQGSQEPVSIVFERLQSQSPDEIHQAAEQLLKRGESDPKVREFLALHLPAIIEKGPAQKNHPGPWITLVRLAGALKIAEAAPALAKWLTIDNIGEITTAGFVKLETNPAGKALSEIGDPSIPALVGVLDHGSLRERRYAVYALNLIGSPRAKNTLREHLKREPDDSLREFIQKALTS